MTRMLGVGGQQAGGAGPRRAVRAAVVLALLAVAAPTAAVAAPADRAAQLQRELGGRATEVATDRDTGLVRFLGTAPGRPLARPDGAAPGAAPAGVARAFLAGHGAAFGVRDAAGELAVERVAGGPRDGSSVRFEQRRDGVPVLGGELIVNLDGAGRVLSVSGEAIASRRLAAVDLQPAVTASAAERTARAAIARAHGVDPAGLAVAPATLEVYDPRLLGAPSPRPGSDGPLLVWRTEVTGGGAGELRELVLVDAQLGVVALHFDQLAEAKDRSVCDAGNANAQLPCASPVRTEGGAAVVSPQDVDDAYDYAGDTYDFYFSRFGRDSLDGAGLPLVSTVRYCPSAASEDCPYGNAFWNGEQMVYGEGFAAADDVVGHELTHGVTEFSSHLFYYYQSGAINESLSDVFGELIDQVNGAGNDDPSVKWLLGEDVPGYPGGLRDMADPTTFGDPDRMTSPNYYADTGETDAGGVHWNSGVNNKAAYLLTDGDTFNGETVAGLGIDKVAQIYYAAATTLLTSASDYADLAVALPQACANLVGTHGIVAADCTQVAAAVRAVEMDRQPPAAPAPEAPVCDSGDPVATAYADDFENPASGRWTVVPISGDGGWYHSLTGNPYDFDARYARSGTGNLWGDDPSTLGDYAIAMTGDVTVPSSGFMRFEHAFGFDDDAGGAYDGGVLEHSTDHGLTWSDAGPLMVDDGYTGAIASMYDNPLAGRSAFVRESNGYRSTRLDLGALAGQPIRFRFRIGADSVIGDYGWFVDDVRIYACTTPPVAPPASPPASPGTSAPSPQPVAPKAPEAATPVLAPVASLAGRRATVRRGRVRLVLRCQAGGGACRGEVRLGRGGRFGSASFAIADGDRATVVVRLARRARRALARRGRLRTTAAVTTRLAGASGSSRSATLTIALPRR